MRLSGPLLGTNVDSLAFYSPKLMGVCSLPKSHLCDFTVTATAVARTSLPLCEQCQTPGSLPIIHCAVRVEHTCLLTSSVTGCHTCSSRGRLCGQSGGCADGRNEESDCTREAGATFARSVDVSSSGLRLFPSLWLSPEADIESSLLWRWSSHHLARWLRSRFSEPLPQGRPLCEPQV